MKQMRMVVLTIAISIIPQLSYSKNRVATEVKAVGVTLWNTTMGNLAHITSTLDLNPVRRQIARRAYPATVTPGAIWRKYQDTRKAYIEPELQIPELNKDVSNQKVRGTAIPEEKWSSHVESPIPASKLR